MIFFTKNTDLNVFFLRGGRGGRLELVIFLIRVQI